MSVEPTPGRAGAILGFDTATAYLTVAVTRDGEVVCEADRGPDEAGRPRASRLLLGEIERSVDRAGGWDQIGRIAVGLGPGSFTGLRIGIATARALAQARDLPLAGISTLAALARGILEGAPAEATDAAEAPLALAAIDARRGQLFAALYGSDGEELWAPLVASPEELADRLGALEGAPLAAGDGSIRFREQLEAAGAKVAAPDDPVHRVAARRICALGEATAATPPEKIEPHYLRVPDAEKWIQRNDRDLGTRD